MVTLAQSSPGDRSARAPQSKTATVMLGTTPLTVIASWDRWIRHRPALDESLRLDVGSMTPFLSDFLPRDNAPHRRCEERSDAAIHSFFSWLQWIASRRS